MDTVETKCENTCKVLISSPSHHLASLVVWADPREELEHWLKDKRKGCINCISHKQATMLATGFGSSEHH